MRSQSFAQPLIEIELSHDTACLALTEDHNLQVQWQSVAGTAHKYNNHQVMHCTSLCETLQFLQYVSTIFNVFNTIPIAISADPCR